MERSSITKWLLAGLAVFLFIQFGWPAIFGSKTSEHQPAPTDITSPAGERPPEQICKLEGDRFGAELSSRGGTLKRVVLTDKQYFGSDGQPMNLVTTSAEARMPLRTDLRAPEGGDQQVAYDDLDWKLTESSASRCTFTFEDASTLLTKTITAAGGPYQLAVTLDVKNKSAEPKRHRLAIEDTAWRTVKETEGHLGRQSEFVTNTIVVSGNDKVERHGPSDFAPGDFAKKDKFNAENWRKMPGDAHLASVSSVYFSKLLIPEAGPGPVSGEARVEEWWDKARYPVKTNDPQYGHIYRARLAYPTQTLAPGATASYKLLSFNGPKERPLLDAIDHGATHVLDHGMFPPIVKVLVGYLHALYGFVKSWGLAIVLMTITVRILVFPLSLSQIKNSIAMRKLKPDMDVINEKFKDDAAQRGLAIQELWRKNKVANPVVGCLPMLLQMPVWWALYTVLQNEVSLYHTPFGPVIPDLSAPGKYFIIPIVLGASSFLQQKLMPAQGDPQQQKMMLYMMPAIFTFMMLFLPAGLGVYMLTNSLLAIGQQLLVERYLKGRAEPPTGQIEVREKTSGDGDKPSPALGKGKARARG